MIKKIYALILVCSVLSLHAKYSSPWLEIKPGYFHFSNNILSKMYGGGWELQASGSYQLWKMMGLYGSVGYLHAKGKSLYGNEKTSVYQIPFDVGLRAIHSMNEYIQCYISIGPRYFHFHQKNTSPYVDKNIHKNGFGFFINTGCNFIKNKRWIIGIFGEYAFEQKSFTSSLPNVYGSQDTKLGGFTIGASLGFLF